MPKIGNLVQVYYNSRVYRATILDMHSDSSVTIRYSPGVLETDVSRTRIFSLKDTVDLDMVAEAVEAAEAVAAETAEAAETAAEAMEAETAEAAETAAEAMVDASLVGADIALHCLNIMIRYKGGGLEGIIIRRWGLRVLGNKTTLATQNVNHYNYNPTTMDSPFSSQRGPLPQINLRVGQGLYMEQFPSMGDCITVQEVLIWNPIDCLYEFTVLDEVDGIDDEPQIFPYSKFHKYFTESPPHRNIPPPVAASNSTATATVTTPSRMSPIDINLANDTYLLSMPPSRF